jgi:sec-independent protein translocase protein TatC
MTDPSPNTDASLPLVAHLAEMRDRLLRGVLAVLVLFSGLFYFANDLYTLLAEPLMSHLPQDASMIATDVTSPFFTPMKLTLVLSVFLCIPYLLYQLWSFIAPGLYLRERKLILPLVVSSAFLFYLGMCFAYFVVFPLVFGFLTGVAPDGITVMTDMAKYLDFVLKLFFAFGLAFEIPIATLVLIWTGAASVESLTEKRPYIIVGVFIFAMLITPPDVISQTLLAIPMWLLFEAGILVARYLPENNPDTPDDFQNLSESEMEAELDRMDQQDRENNSP